MNIMDQLYKRISELKNPTVAGLDTRIEYLPESFVNEIMPEGIKSFEDAAEAVYQYNVRLVDALYDIVPSVKVQVAYYEMYGAAGMVAFEKTMAYAKSKGMIVMADVKRNDIGATAACYANAYIGKTVRCLIDGESDDARYDLTARTPGNRLVRLTGDRAAIGQYRDVTITGCNKWSLFGELV